MSSGPEESKYFYPIISSSISLFIFSFIFFLSPSFICLLLYLFLSRPIGVVSTHLIWINQNITATLSFPIMSCIQIVSYHISSYALFIRLVLCCVVLFPLLCIFVSIFVTWIDNIWLD